MDSGYLPLYIMKLIFKIYFKNNPRIDILKFRILNKYYLSKIKQIIKCYPKERNNFKIHYYELKNKRNELYEIKKFVTTKYLKGIFKTNPRILKVKFQDFYEKCKIVCCSNCHRIIINNNSKLMKIVCRNEVRYFEGNFTNKGTIILSGKGERFYINCKKINIKKEEIYFLQFTAQKVISECQIFQVKRLTFWQARPCNFKIFKNNILKLQNLLNNESLKEYLTEQFNSGRLLTIFQSSDPEKENVLFSFCGDGVNFDVLI